MSVTTELDKREKAMEACRAWYHRNLESERKRSIEKTRLRYSQNRDKVLEEGRRWREKHHEKVRSRQKQYHLENREKRIANFRAYQKRKRETDPEWVRKTREAGKIYYRNNRDRIRAKQKERQQLNPGYWVNKKHTRRARQLAATVNPRSIQIYCSGVKNKKTAKCYYCEKVVSTNNIHFDHIIPLSKGGPHSVENICVSCSHCNLSKHANMIGEWMKLGQQILEL